MTWGSFESDLEVNLDLTGEEDVKVSEASDSSQNLALCVCFLYRECLPTYPQGLVPHFPGAHFQMPSLRTDLSSYLCKNRDTHSLSCLAFLLGS